MPYNTKNPFSNAVNFQILWKQVLLVVVLCIPLYFINVKNSHDWGDDFAQYLHQAENIMQGKPAYDTGYLYNERFPFLGPPAYPPGFPLLLAPLTLFAGKQIIPYAYLITTFLVLFTITTFLFFSEKMESWKALILAMILTYNPWFLNFKSEVVSDLPYSFFLLSAILLFGMRKHNISFVLLFGLLLGFINCIRWVGFVLPISIFAYTFIRFIKDRSKDGKSDFVNFGIIVPFISLLFYGVLNFFIFPVNAPDAAGNNQLLILFQSVSMQSIQINISNYSELIKNFFCFPSQVEWSYAGRIWGYILLLSTVIGLTMSFCRKPALKDWFFLIYLILLIVYPYGSSGLRFLIPLMVFLFIYTYQLFDFIPLSGILSKMSFAILVLLTYFIYHSETKKIIRDNGVIIWGPQRYDAREMFSYISRNTDKSDHILFIKPRALSYYTGRSSFANYPNEQQQIFRQQLSKYAIRYLLDDKEMPNPALTEFLKDTTKYISVFQAPPFYLYEIK